MDGAKLLEFRHICKSFPGVKALDDINIDLDPGEVHILVGENGAGKSTLMKVLSGAYEATSGNLFFEGKKIEKNSPRISMIYQELNLVPELSIASNIFLGHEIRKGPFVDRAAQEKRANELLSDIGIVLFTGT